MSLSIYLTQGARNEGSLSRLGVCELPRCFTTIRALLNHEFLRSQIEDYIETQAKARRALWPPSLFLRLESSQKFLY